MQTFQNTEIAFTQEPIKLKLNFSKPCEAKIRTASEIFPHNEWSGVAFYTFKNNKKGDSDINNIELTVVDFCLQDIGTPFYTEYEMGADSAAYYADHIDTLLGTKIALLHSHNSMAAFFSSIDKDTLKEQAAQCNNVLSIVVNNDGNYVAKFTERHMLHQKRQINTSTVEQDHWNYMGEKDYDDLKTYKDTDFIEKDIIDLHVWDCEIQRPLNQLVDEEFKQVCLKKWEEFKQKKPLQKSSNIVYYDDLFSKKQTNQVNSKPTSDIKTMYKAIITLSFNPDTNKIFLPKEYYTEPFLNAFMYAWDEFYRPTIDQIEAVSELIEGAMLPKEMKTYILNYLDDEINLFNNILDDGQL